MGFYGGFRVWGLGCDWDLGFALQGLWVWVWGGEVPLKGWKGVIGFFSGFLGIRVTRSGIGRVDV